MKSLNNIQNAQASEFELFPHLSTVILHFYYSEHNSQNIRKNLFHPLFQKKVTPQGLMRR